MRIDRLGIDLQPRPHAQALDLGFALLRAHAGDVWRTWLALWLPAMALALLLAWLLPRYAPLWLSLPWWLRPALERGPLHVLSRGVFGERTGWRAALRAWPRECGGGMVRMLTWWRPFMAGRGLHHPVWQLERARGIQATRRRRLLARSGTGRAAWLFGMACFGFEIVLYLGTAVFIGLFMPDNVDLSPFQALNALGEKTFASSVLMAAALALSGGIIGPVYVACCFTLYLNRRATLEAWDIELVLRRLQQPAGSRRGARTMPLLVLACALSASLLLAPQPARAAPLSCEPPAPPSSMQQGERGPAHDAAQGRLRGEIDRLFDEPDLRGYRCVETWGLKDPGKPQPRQKRQQPELSWLSSFALLLKYALIGGAVAAAAWLLYRYRDRLPGLPQRQRAAPATEIGGLDIRPASLPDDVPAAARALWQAGQPRAALALLYRATLSRLASDDSLHLHPGATEGDCLRLAQRAHDAGRLAAPRLALAGTVTRMWLEGAYAGRWPTGPGVEAACDAWRERFDQRAAMGTQA